jgi:hypothetical protein
MAAMVKFELKLPGFYAFRSVLAQDSGVEWGSMINTVRTAVANQLSDIKQGYLKDMDALPEEQFFVRHTPASRRMIDIVHECSLVHQLLGARLKGEEPGEWWSTRLMDDEKFIVAPEGTTVTSARAHFVSSLDEIISLVQSATDEQLMGNVKTSSGEEPFFALALYAGIHSIYHNGQLAFAQGLAGDAKNHWF